MIFYTSCGDYFDIITIDEYTIVRAIAAYGLKWSSKMLKLFSSSFVFFCSFSPKMAPKSLLVVLKSRIGVSWLRSWITRTWSSTTERFESKTALDKCYTVTYKHYNTGYISNASIFMTKCVCSNSNVFEKMNILRSSFFVSIIISPFMPVSVFDS